jgi:hypothetical protein
LSIEAILAFFTLLVTCIPLAVHFWRKYRRQHQVAHPPHGMGVANQTTHRLALLTDPARY